MTLEKFHLQPYISVFISKYPMRIALFLFFYSDMKLPTLPREYTLDLLYNDILYSCFTV